MASLSTNGHEQAGAIELGALDLYDAHGLFLGRITLEGDRHMLALDLRTILPLLIASSCTAVILRHHHPSGNAAPSRADITTTRRFANLLELLDIRLHDHLIEASRGQFSFRAEGLI